MLVNVPLQNVCQHFGASACYSCLCISHHETSCFYFIQYEFGCFFFFFYRHHLSAANCLLHPWCQHVCANLLQSPPICRPCEQLYLLFALYMIVF